MVGLTHKLLLIYGNWWNSYRLESHHLSRIRTKPTKWLCAQRSSDQRLRCALNGWPRTQAFFMQTVKTDQTGRMPRLIWVFAGHTLILLVLSQGSSFIIFSEKFKSTYSGSKTIQQLCLFCCLPDIKSLDLDYLPCQSKLSYLVFQTLLLFVCFLLHVSQSTTMVMSRPPVNLRFSWTGSDLSCT